MRQGTANSDKTPFDAFQQTQQTHVDRLLAEHPFDVDYAGLNMLKFLIHSRANAQLALRNPGISTTQKQALELSLQVLDYSPQERKETFIKIFIRSEQSHLLTEQALILKKLRERSDLLPAEITAFETQYQLIERQLLILKNALSQVYLFKQKVVLSEQKKQLEKKLHDDILYRDSILSEKETLEVQLHDLRENCMPLLQRKKETNEKLTTSYSSGDYESDTVKTLETETDEIEKMLANFYAQENALEKIRDELNSEQNKLQRTAQALAMTETQLSLVNSYLTENEPYSVLSEKKAAQTTLDAFITTTLGEIDASYDALCNTPHDETKWQSHMLAQYRKTQPDYTKRSAEEFITFLLAHCNDLPTAYGANNNALSTASIRFPSSPNGDHIDVFTHIDHGVKSDSRLLAANAPIRFDLEPAKNPIVLARYLEMLAAQNVAYIICLGGNSARLDYREATSERFQTNFSKDEKSITLIDKQNHTKKTIGYSSFDVKDNTSLELNNESLHELLDAYTIYQTKTVLVHCDSGVGRTGQVRLLFALLDQYQVDPVLNLTINRALALLSQPKLTARNEKELNNALHYIFNEMSTIITHLRRIRYAIQTEVQLEGTLPQLFLLIAAQKGYTDEQLNTLRETIILKKEVIVLYTTTGKVIDVKNALADSIQMESPITTPSTTPIRSRCGSFSLSKNPSSTILQQTNEAGGARLNRSTQLLQVPSFRFMGTRSDSNSSESSDTSSAPLSRTSSGI